ncbi:unnamed protein product [Cuscuta campestris]|uniref:Reverse transcriptase domain-containing protein n=1 Tax=Cuscuta campestris TaxID=132261 RepID=A0A484M2K9_9ASTE|nr:unnamed protein product [Cuscuta campestris]
MKLMQERQTAQDTLLSNLQAQINNRLPAQPFPAPKENVSVVVLRNNKVLPEPSLGNVRRDQEIMEKELDSQKIQGPGLVNNKSVLTPDTPRAIYKPQPPFPSKYQSQRKNSKEPDDEIFEMFKKVQVNIPLLNAIKNVPKYAKFLKEMCTNKRRLKGDERVNISENVSAIFQKKLPQKCQDPGVFSVPCKIGNLENTKALLDLGASINVMPRELFDQLGVGELKETGVVIQLADRSLTYPEGVVEDVLVQACHNLRNVNSKLSQALNREAGSLMEPVMNLCPLLPVVQGKWGRKAAPSVQFTADEEEVLAGKLCRALIGRSSSRISIKDIEAFLIKGNFKEFKLRRLSSNELLFLFKRDKDYLRWFHRRHWIISSSRITICKWSPDHSPLFDSPVIPVWVEVDQIPLHLQDHGPLFSIASTLGKPLKLSAKTAMGINPVKASCVEMDVSHAKPSKMHVRLGYKDLWLPFRFEEHPPFCSHCKRFGHLTSRCLLSHPSSKAPVGGVGHNGADKFEWKLVTTRRQKASKNSKPQNLSITSKPRPLPHNSTITNIQQLKSKLPSCLSLPNSKANPPPLLPAALLEAVHLIDKKVFGGNLILKLDMAKAFDRIDWVYLEGILTAFGFNPHSISLLMANLKGTNFSILINGEPTGYFKMERGVKQGDPLSLLLFIIVVEDFSRLLNHQMNSLILIRFNAGQVPFPSHLIYANDLMIFTRGQKRNLIKLKDTLELYLKASGQQINIQKSKFYTSKKTTNTQAQNMEKAQGIRRGNLPFTYLGATIFWGAPFVSKTLTPWIIHSSTAPWPPWFGTTFPTYAMDLKSRSKPPYANTYLHGGLVAILNTSKAIFFSFYLAFAAGLCVNHVTLTSINDSLLRHRASSKCTSKSFKLGVGLTRIKNGWLRQPFTSVVAHERPMSLVSSSPSTTLAVSRSLQVLPPRKRPSAERRIAPPTMIPFLTATSVLSVTPVAFHLKV